MIITGNTTETDKKKNGRGYWTHRIASFSLHCLPSSLYLDSEYWKPDTSVRPEMGTKTHQPELWINPYQA